MRTAAQLLFVCATLVCATIALSGCSKAPARFCRVIERERAGLDPNATPRQRIATLETIARDLAAADRRALLQLRDLLQVGQHPESYTVAQQVRITRDYVRATLHLDARLKAECGRDLGPISPGFLGITTTTRPVRASP